MIYFTSDWHLGDLRLKNSGLPNVFYRPFTSVKLQNNTIFDNFRSVFRDGDTLIHLGDVIIGPEGNSYGLMDQLRDSYPNSQFELILGNYDEGKEHELSQWFDEIKQEAYLLTNNIFPFEVYLNHYPLECKKVLEEYPQIALAVTGHIHGLWKIQKKMINVGVDAWHFFPVSLDEINFCYSAMVNHYDGNAFPYAQ